MYVALRDRHRGEQGQARGRQDRRSTTRPTWPSGRTTRTTWSARRTSCSSRATTTASAPCSTRRPPRSRTAPSRWSCRSTWPRRPRTRSGWPTRSTGSSRWAGRATTSTPPAKPASRPSSWPRTLREEGARREADALLAALPAAEARDLFIRLTWDGDADYDLVVQEPLGAAAQFSMPRTVFGGSIIKNGYGNHPEEVYVCPRGFDGDYTVRIATIYTNPEEAAHPAHRSRRSPTRGRPRNTRRASHLVPDDPKAKPVVVHLTGGRRKTVLPFLSPAAIVESMTTVSTNPRKPATAAAPGRPAAQEPPRATRGETSRPSRSGSASGPTPRKRGRGSAPARGGPRTSSRPHVGRRCDPDSRRCMIRGKAAGPDPAVRPGDGSRSGGVATATRTRWNRVEVPPTECASCHGIQVCAASPGESSCS